MELALAINGSALSTALGVLALVQYRSTRTAVHIKPFKVNAPARMGGPGQLMLKVVNRSAHPIQITSFTVRSAEPSRAMFWPRPFPTDLPLPTEVGARRHVMVWGPVGDDLPQPFTAAVYTADDREFKTKPFRLEDLVEMDHHDPEKP